MSYDFRLKGKCDHHIVKEYHTVNDDRKTVRLDRSITNAVGIKLYKNGYEIDRNSQYFPWILEKDELSVDPNKRKIVFVDELPSDNDWVEVSYYTSPQNCRKCHGLKILYDLYFSNTGKLLTVKNEEKLLQDVEKAVFTILNSNQYHSWYGTEIYKLIGQIRNDGYLKARIAKEINTTLEHIRKLQIDQKIKIGQKVTNREAIDRISSVNVKRSDIDPTVLNIAIELISKAGEFVGISNIVKTSDFNLYKGV